jgi:hypothetical protein
MTKPKERKHVYQRRASHKDYLRAHNQVWPWGNGFREFWIPPEWAEKGGGWSLCSCGGRKGQPHYALSGHARAWKKRIKNADSPETQRESAKVIAEWKRWGFAVSTSKTKQEAMP